MRTDITIMRKRLKQTITKKIRSNAGVTMVELLCATLIVLLVSSGMVTGVQLAQQQFIRSIRISEAQELYATLKTILSNELRYTTHVQYADNGTNEVATFYSVTYAVKNYDTALVALDEDNQPADYGELALGYNGEYNKIIGSSSYANGLGAQARVTYDKAKKIFTVDLKIAVNGEPCIENQSFQVRALNSP